MKSLVKLIVPTSFHRGPLIERTRGWILNDAVVRGGPFAGMKYIRLQVGAPLLPKLLGTYELEITPVLMEIEKLKLPTIIDVGAGEGYYAVGLAMRNRQARVVAYEQNPQGRIAIGELARLNGVSDRVEARGRCGLADLTADIEGGAPGFLMVDIEGGEDELLDPRQLPALRHWHILFEAHDLFVPGVGQRVCDRFASTHVVEEFRSRPRKVDDIAFLGPLFKRYALKHCLTEWTAERTAPMSWYLLRPVSHT